MFAWRNWLDLTPLNPKQECEPRTCQLCYEACGWAVIFPLLFFWTYGGLRNSFIVRGG